MTTLYIIGNGFDLWHGLPTSYDLFYEYAKETLHELDSYFIDKSHSGLWNDFENSLSTFNWRLFYEAHDNTDISAEDFRPSEAFSLEDDLTEQADNIVTAIKEHFHDWICGIDVLAAEKKMSFQSNDLFLTFNYTSTLQLVYGIDSDRVVHIHGRSDTFDELVFGHGATMEEVPELDENGDSNRTMFSDAEGAAKYPFHALQKPVNEVIARNSSFFLSLSGMATIIVIGHSLNEIDLPYFREVAKNAKNAKWVVCCYMPDDEDHHIQKLLECGIQKKMITACTYAELQGTFVP
jgi:hypothetical protein